MRKGSDKDIWRKINKIGSITLSVIFLVYISTLFVPKLKQNIEYQQTLDNLRLRLKNTELKILRNVADFVNNRIMRVNFSRARFYRKGETVFVFLMSQLCK